MDETPRRWKWPQHPVRLWRGAPASPPTADRRMSDIASGCVYVGLGLTLLVLGVLALGEKGLMFLGGTLVLIAPLLIGVGIVRIMRAR